MNFQNIYDNLQSFSKEKEELLNKANVLVISLEDKEYNCVKNYGFKNVNWFKSVTVADSYFKENPDELEKYDIIFEGKRIDGHSPLDDKIVSLVYKTKTINVSSIEYENGTMDFYVRGNGHGEDVYVHNYEEGVDGAVAYAIKIDALEKINNRPQEFKPIIQKKVEKLPLPKKKKELKILYLCFPLASYANDIAQELGLDVTFKKDDNSALDEHVKSNLGNYDVIIASDIYSNQLVGGFMPMSQEALEQCKMTGRNMVLLLKYHDRSIGIDGLGIDGIGNEVYLSYGFSGLTHNEKVQKMNYRVLRKNYDKDALHEKSRNSIESIMKSVLEQAVNIYNENLTKLGCNSLVDLDFKTSEVYNEEYKKVELEINKKLEDEKNAFEQKLKEIAQKDNEYLAMIKDIDELREYMFNYLKYKKEGLITGCLNGVKIYKNKQGICLEEVSDSKSVSKIILPFRRQNGKVRRFIIQTSSNGVLSNPEVIGIYTSEYVNEIGVTKLINKDQANVINSMKDKLQETLNDMIKKSILNNNSVSINNRKR